MVLKQFLSVVALFIWSGTLVAQSPEVAEETSGEQVLIKEAKAYAKALKKHDFEKQLALTHPKVIKHYGGKASMLAAATREAEQTKRSGFNLKNAELADPLPGKAIGETFFRCIPIRITVEGPYGDIYSQSGLLGISEDGGKHWNFVSLAQIEMAVLLELFPNMPKDLEIPFNQVTTEK
jgi:hypothetical protein